MQFNVLNRKIHYWAGFVVAIPVLVMIGSSRALRGAQTARAAQTVKTRY